MRARYDAPAERRLNGGVPIRGLGIVVADRVATIALHRPPGNELTLDLVEELVRALARLEEDRSTQAIVITSRLRFAFCTGSEIEGRSPDGAAKLLEQLQNAERMQVGFRRIEDCAKPVIAAINGVASGAGLDLALVCDLRVASELADFILPELVDHLIPSLGATQRLARVVGMGRAKELLMLGRCLKAHEALSWGLVNEVAPERKTLARALALAHELAAKPAEAFAALKRSIHRGFDTPRDTALYHETRELHSLLARRAASHG